jgi:hypothetical protein
LELDHLKEVVRVVAAGTAELTTLSPDISSCNGCAYNITKSSVKTTNKTMSRMDRLALENQSIQTHIDPKLQDLRSERMS